MHEIMNDMKRIQQDILKCNQKILGLCQNLFYAKNQHPFSRSYYTEGAFYSSRRGKKMRKRDARRQSYFSYPNNIKLPSQNSKGKKSGKVLNNPSTTQQEFVLNAEENIVAEKIVANRKKRRQKRSESISEKGINSSMEGAHMEGVQAQKLKRRFEKPRYGSNSPNWRQQARVLSPSLRSNGYGCIVCCRNGNRIVNSQDQRKFDRHKQREVVWDSRCVFVSPHSS